MTKVLVVEDNANLAFGLTRSLESEGYEVEAAEDGVRGFELARTTNPDLVVLDLMLPGMDGYTILKKLRAEVKDVPVLILTARGEEADKVFGFRLGADDYVTKPFSVRELVLRVGAILRARRPAPAAAAQPAPQRRRYIVGPLELDVDGYHVFVSGAEVHVSTLEMRLLVYLVEHRGRVRSREDLLEDVWGYKPGVSTRTIDTHVKRLRDKLGDAGALVETVRGTGYRLSAEHPVVVKD